ALNRAGVRLIVAKDRAQRPGALGGKARNADQRSHVPVPRLVRMFMCHAREGLRRRWGAGDALARKRHGAPGVLKAGVDGHGSRTGKPDDQHEQDNASYHLLLTSSPRWPAVDLESAAAPYSHRS